MLPLILNFIICIQTEMFANIWSTNETVSLIIFPFFWCGSWFFLVSHFCFVWLFCRRSPLRPPKDGTGLDASKEAESRRRMESWEFLLSRGIHAAAGCAMGEGSSPSISTLRRGLPEGSRDADQQFRILQPRLEAEGPKSRERDGGERFRAEIRGKGILCDSLEHHKM